MASRARLHAELIAFVRQHCPVADERHLTLLGWMGGGDAAQPDRLLGPLAAGPAAASVSGRQLAAPLQALA
jgi:hypothetical protein